MKFGLRRFFYERKYRYFSRPIDRKFAWAIWANDFAKARELYRKGADPDARGENGKPLIFYHLTDEMGEQFDLLRELGASLTAISDNGETLLMAAASSGDDHLLRQALAAGVPVDSQDKDGKTALMYALPLDCGHVVETLIEAGADTQLKDSRGQTALQQARIQGALACEERLMAAMEAQG